MAAFYVVLYIVYIRVVFANSGAERTAKRKEDCAWLGAVVTLEAQARRRYGCVLMEMVGTLPWAEHAVTNFLHAYRVIARSTQVPARADTPDARKLRHTAHSLRNSSTSYRTLRVYRNLSIHC